MLHDMAKEGARFLISTHSPILMAYPDADLYEIQEGKLVNVSFDEIGHVNLTRNFLNEPSAIYDIYWIDCPKTMKQYKKATPT